MHHSEALAWNGENGLSAVDGVEDGDRGSERAMRLSFWSLNVGLARMLYANLFPLGLLQLNDSLACGYWHARRIGFFLQPLVRGIALPGRGQGNLSQPRRRASQAAALLQLRQGAVRLPGVRGLLPAPDQDLLATAHH